MAWKNIQLPPARTCSLWIEVGGQFWRVGGHHPQIACDGCGAMFDEGAAHLCLQPQDFDARAVVPERPKRERRPKPEPTPVSGLILKWKRAC